MMMKEADTDGDGQISYKEFAQLVTKDRSLYKKFMNEKGIQEEYNPYDELNFGTQAYLNIFWKLSLMCFIISLFCIPLFWVYTNGQNEMDTTPIPRKHWAQISLGNLGGSSVRCLNKFID